MSRSLLVWLFHWIYSCPLCKEYVFSSPNATRWQPGRFPPWPFNPGWRWEGYHGCFHAISETERIIRGQHVQILFALLEPCLFRYPDSMKLIHHCYHSFLYNWFMIELRHGYHSLLIKLIHCWLLMIIWLPVPLINRYQSPPRAAGRTRCSKMKAQKPLEGGRSCCSESWGTHCWSKYCSVDLESDPWSTRGVPPRDQHWEDDQPVTHVLSFVMDVPTIYLGLWIQCCVQGLRM